MSIRIGRTTLVVVAFLANAAGAFGGHYAWSTAGPATGTVFQVVVDSSDSDSLFVVGSFFGGYLFRTRDRAGRWDYVEGSAGTHTLVVDPSRSGVFYAPSASGVSKTTDGGHTWRVTSVDGTSVAAVAIAPSNPSTLFAITGSSTGNVHRSTDGGATWSLVSSALPNAFGSLTVDPTDAAVLYLTAYTGVLKSVDGGSTWNPSSTGLPSSAAFIRIDPQTPSRLYAATTDSGVYVSTNAGTDWSPANTGLEWQDIRDLAIDPSNPARLFAASYGSTSPPVLGGVYVSTDSGGTWTTADLGIAGLNYGTAIAVDPHDSRLLYAGVGSSALRGNVLKSSDGGVSWSIANTGLSGYLSDGVAPVAGAPASAVSISGADVYGTTDGGATWVPRSSLEYFLTSVLDDPSNPATLYAEYGGDMIAGVYKSIDGGASWADASAGLTSMFEYHIAIGESDPQTLLTSADDGVFRTTDGGGTWTNVLSGSARGVAVDPADPLILYAGHSYLEGQPGFLRSADGGATWDVPAGMPSVEAQAWAIRVEPSRADHVYAALGDRIYRSTDRGLSFAPADAGLPTGTPSYLLAIDRSSAGTLYAVSAFGGPVFRTSDSAATWSPLPFVPALTLSDLSVSSNGRRLFAATVSGVFQFERSFLDVPDTAPVWRFVDAAAMNGLTAGCGDGNFCAGSTLTRAQAAVFLVKAAKGAAFVPPAATGGVFADVPASSFAAAWIEELAREGVTAGCGGTGFCPGSSLTRAEMAVFVLRAAHGPAYTPPLATGTVFSDVPANAFAAAWIEELFHEGLAAGCGGGLFCSDAATTRGQAVTLVVGAFGLQ